MGVYNSDGVLERYTLIDVFYDAETKKIESPTRWWGIWMEIKEDVDPPIWILKLSWRIGDYIKWWHTPRGVTSTCQQQFKKKYVWKSWVDVENFQYDGIGDTDYTEERYVEFDTEEEALRYLKKNIYTEDRLPSKLDTVEEFCKQYQFEFYERKY